MLKSLYYRLPGPLKPLAAGAFRRLRMGKFERIKYKCNGMLPAEVYYSLYLYGTDIGEGNILEIGSAHGAATVSLALGVKDGGGSATVIGVEKGEGGSRSMYGSREENIEILRENLREFGVAERVKIVNQHLSREGGLPENIQSAQPFSLVCLDADGNLDRDFQLLYENILPGSVIMIDDYSPLREYREKTDRYPLGGGKHYRTFSYANWLLDRGFLHRYKTIGDTLITVKPPSPPSMDQLDEISDIREHIETDRGRHG